MSPKKIKFMVGAALIVGSIGYLISTSISKTSMYFVTVGELASRGMDSFQGEVLKVKGNVVKGSIVRNPKDFLDVAFVIADKDAPDGKTGNHKKSNLKVQYKGVTPDMFIDDGEVVVEGVIKGGVFHANTLLTSCPSKYEAEREAGKSHPDGLSTYDLKDSYQKKPVSATKTTI
ncbi:MAG: cytochrome c maturation protein CcmE [Nitrospinales bacterium]